ncbi:MAG: tetratricopeptide repeat protein [Chlamydiales bacterium]
MFIAFVAVTLALISYLAIRQWARTLRLSSATVQNTLGEISRHISLEEWDLAASKLIPLLENKKGGKQAQLFHIQILRQEKAYTKARNLVLQAMRDYPEELLFRLEEAKILLKLGEYQEALEAFHFCSPILRTESDICAIAEAYLRCGYPTQCFDMIEPWLAHTKEGKFFALAAWAHFSLKDFGKTIAYTQQALELGYRTHKLMIQLGHAYRRYGNLAGAEQLFRSLLEKDAMDIAALLGLGACFQERGLYQKALLLYQAGPLWKKKDNRLLAEATLCALNIERYSHAEEYLQLLLEKEEPTSKILSYYGYCLEKQKKWQEAEQSYLRLIQTFPSDPNGYRALAWMFGVGLTQTLSKEQALNFAHIALNIHADALTWEILSACEARIGNFSRAYEIQKFLSEHDQDRESRTRRQGALRRLRQQTPLTDDQIIHILVA